MMSSYYILLLLLQVAPSFSQLPSNTSHICPLTYYGDSPLPPFPASQWLTILTACLAPLVVHIAAGVPRPTIIGSKEEAQEKPPWSDLLPHFNPVSILWRYYAIADRRLRSRDWGKEEMAATNALFWDGSHWDGSEAIMIRSRSFPSHLADSSHVDLVSVSTLKTITMVIQGAYFAYIISAQDDVADVSSFFAPLAIIGLFRLQSALWLSDEAVYLFFGSWEAPVTTTPFGTRISEALHSTRSWRGVVFRSWWIVSALGLVAFDLYNCVGDWKTWTSPDRCLFASALVQRVFYTVFTLGILGIHSFYVLRGRSCTTIIPCIHSRWYKVYTYLMIALAVVGIAIGCVETRLGWFDTVCQPLGQN
ncbi:hypothetical protein NA56DRAFT_651851 [Hyaloscypha hepaticicola]|uniref:Uncharacterized protein n=1 Tax=Hyaloscypha hepaticicola TaxID=2082293 RepID=A0A2J6PHB5_9HELO|nr:hypothetical protein NA56DRAFT_651851 [Hyaloscypha hepaticicola]